MNKEINAIFNLLNQSQVAILPSDTLYGLASNAYDEKAVELAYKIKNQAISKKMPIHYYCLEQAANDIIITPIIEALAEKFLPGGLTIVAQKKPDSKLKLIDDTVAFRIPNHETLRNIIKELNAPITMPSANRHGSQPRMKFSEIKQEFAEHGYNLNGIEDDAHIANIASTIVEVINTQPTFCTHKIEVANKREMCADEEYAKAHNFNLIREGVIKFSDIIQSLKQNCKN